MKEQSFFEILMYARVVRFFKTLWLLVLCPSLSVWKQEPNKVSKSLVLGIVLTDSCYTLA